MRLFSLAFASIFFFFSSFAFAAECIPRVLDEGTLYQPFEIRGDLNGDADLSECELKNLVAVIVGVVMTAPDLSALVKDRPQIVEELSGAEALLLDSLMRTGGMQIRQALSSRVPLPGASSWTLQDIDARLYWLLFFAKNFHPQYFCGLIYYILPEASSEALSSQAFVLTPETIRKQLESTLFSRGLLSPEDIDLSCGPPLL